MTEREIEEAKGLDLAIYSAKWEEAKSYAAVAWWPESPGTTSRYWNTVRARFFKLGGECIYPRASFDVEIGSVHKVTVSHRNKAREVWVKVLPNDGYVWGYKCVIVGGKATKLLHCGRVLCVKPEQFKKENELSGLRNTVFEF